MSYEHIERPYDSLMRRVEIADPSKIMSDEAARPMSLELIQQNQQASRVLVGGEEIDDLRIKTIIQSKDWKPQLVGFKIDGRTGAAYFNHVLISSRNPWPGLDIKKTDGDGSGIYIEMAGANTGHAIDILQKSDTAAISIVSEAITGAGGGGTINAVNQSGDGAVAVLEQQGAGVVAYLEHENPEVGETHFYPIVLMSGGNFTNLVKFWISDGADPNGDLSGLIGDICYDKSGTMWECQGGTVWLEVINTSNIPLPDFGPGTDGAATITVDTHYTTTKYFTDLTINAGVNLTSTCHIYVNGTLTVNGTIHANGGDGGDGANAVDGVTYGNGGAAGAASTGSTFAGGKAGATGGNGGETTGGPTPPVAGTNGVGSAKCLTGVYTGRAGAAGGSGGLDAGETQPHQSGAGGGSGGSPSGYATLTSIKLPWHGHYMCDFNGALFVNAVCGAGGSGGGGGGGFSPPGAPGYGGGGAGSGASGGMLVIFARTVVVGATGIISANGGTGGNGGNGSNATVGPAGGGGGGGAGSGGNGGLVVLFYHSLSNSGSIVATRGSAGANRGLGGTGITYTNGADGAWGQDGNNGFVVTLQI